jgi:hypothetical protein
MSSILDELVSRVEADTSSWLRKNYKQRFTIGHPADYIMPPIKYCLYAVKENMLQSGDTSIDNFIQSFKFCMTDIVSAISRASGFIVEEEIPRVRSELSGKAKPVEAKAK